MLKHLSSASSRHHHPHPSDHLRTSSINGLSDSTASSHQSDRQHPANSRRLLGGIQPDDRMTPHPSHHGQTQLMATGRHYSSVNKKGSNSMGHMMENNSSKHSLSSPTTSVSPTAAAVNQTKTTLTNLDGSRLLDESLMMQPYDYGGPLSSSVFVADRSANHGIHPHNNSAAYLSNSQIGHLSKGASVNGGMHIRRASPLPTSVTKLAAATRQVTSSVIGVREMLTSLGLLCLLSLMMAMLGLIFLLKMSPPPVSPPLDASAIIHDVDQMRIVTAEEAGAVYEVALALCSLAVTLDVCCCLVCATQLVFAARLITASTCSATNSSRERIKKFLKDSAVTRICAVAGFFVSIPVFLTDIVLYTILHFPSTPAITTSIVTSVGMVLCGCAMLHNIVVWHRHKSTERSLAVSGLPDLSGIEKQPGHPHLRIMSPVIGQQMPPATLDLSALNSNLSSSHMLELSTLV